MVIFGHIFFPFPSPPLLNETCEQSVNPQICTTSELNTQILPNSDRVAEKKSSGSSIIWSIFQRSISSSATRTNDDTPQRTHRSFVRQKIHRSNRLCITVSVQSTKTQKFYGNNGNTCFGGPKRNKTNACSGIRAKC
ncbi:hypothetical protein HanXRQr2_Chr02g0052861 [Helianthus annuus]|uniref:Uncharacterized protein n=1 Tax=Helianthus annuus TaxID=4232 RepID=A0A9K3JLU1_HELAN|nr:hypothetical protein HanXRQr2_Chr02g0052861 [Helianthus annuus]